MRIAYLNINKAVKERAQRLTDYLAALDADVIGLGEMTRSNADGFFDRFKALGYSHHCFKAPDGPKGSIGVVSRRAPETMRIATMQARSGHDGIPRMAQLQVNGLDLTFVYFPNQVKKLPYFKRILRDGRKLVRTGAAAALIGDFNTGDREDYGGSKGIFTGQAEFDGLKSMGFRDVMLEGNPGGREWTWKSTFGNGFRLDQSLGTEAFANQVQGACYDHSPREQRLTDHSAMIIDLQSCS
jgi:exodeoxyribonuclease-3